MNLKDWGAAFGATYRKQGKAFDRIVIETTGLADPAPILHVLMMDPLLVSRLRLEGVITVVDGFNGAAGSYQLTVWCPLNPTPGPTRTPTVTPTPGATVRPLYFPLLRIN